MTPQEIVSQILGIPVSKEYALTWAQHNFEALMTFFVERITEAADERVLVVLKEQKEDLIKMVQLAEEHIKLRDNMVLLLNALNAVPFASLDPIVTSAIREVINNA